MSDFKDNMAFGPNNTPVDEYMEAHYGPNWKSSPSDGSVRLMPGTIGYEAGTTAKIDLVVGMRVRRRSEKWPIYRIGANEVRCEWPRGEATIVVGGLLAELRLLAADGKLLVVGDEDGVDRLPHILWRTAKQLVSLLEKEYGFGPKEVSRRDPIGWVAKHTNTG